MSTLNAQQDTLVTYLDPYGAPGTPVQPYECRLEVSPNPAIALLNNSYVDADAFLEDVSDVIARSIPGAAFAPFDKGSGRNAADMTSPDIIADIASRYDAVLLAYGHCGSCTASLVRDAVVLAQTGVPVVAMVTSTFAEEAAFVARASGLPDLPMVILPYPMAGEAPEFHKAVAANVAPQILRALTTGQVAATETSSNVTAAAA
ncbi:UGSC family (seleno)protein [Sphingobium subterraneum]|uniref:UGSC-like domain-containing protein n=1 Tax=Sphingobium subterraneum TaxID=627688 RepID=A0A841J4C5_9SPHN|nr:hypothetical protein [Sphingobium subterraneum]MBB6123378.1 hypothetical protein [Sphingobium subterraneum]